MCVKKILTRQIGCCLKLDFQIRIYLPEASDYSTVQNTTGMISCKTWNTCVEYSIQKYKFDIQKTECSMFMSNILK